MSQTQLHVQPPPDSAQINHPPDTSHSQRNDDAQQSTRTALLNTSPEEFELEFESSEDEPAAINPVDNPYHLDDDGDGVYSAETVDQYYNLIYGSSAPQDPVPISSSRYALSVADIGLMADVFEQNFNTTLSKSEKREQRRQQLLEEMMKDGGNGNDTMVNPQKAAQAILSQRPDDLASLFQNIPSIVKSKILSQHTTPTNSSSLKTTSSIMNISRQQIKAMKQDVLTREEFGGDVGSKRNKQKHKQHDGDDENDQADDIAPTTLTPAESQQVNITAIIAQHTNRAMALKEITTRLNKSKKQQKQQQLDIMNQQLLLTTVDPPLIENTSDNNKTTTTNPADKPKKKKMSVEEKQALLSQQRLADRKVGLIHWRMLVQAVDADLSAVEEMIYDLHVYPNIIQPHEKGQPQQKERQQQQQQQKEQKKQQQRKQQQLQDLDSDSLFSDDGIDDDIDDATDDDVVIVVPEKKRPRTRSQQQSQNDDHDTEQLELRPRKIAKR